MHWYCAAYGKQMELIFACRLPRTYAYIALNSGIAKKLWYSPLSLA